MTSYSKIFKASNLAILDDVKVIKQPVLMTNQHHDHTVTSGEVPDAIGEQAAALLEEAKAKANAIIDSAEKKAASLVSSAEQQIKHWWDETEIRLADLTREAEQTGYQNGFTQGRNDAELEVKGEYQDKLTQAQDLINQAYQQKEAIISEAEPFLLELSTAIASQILKQELENTDKFVELIKQHILRFREKEYITICVHPDDFELIHTQRAHLIAVVNGETEIKVIPDHSVTPKGCVIRTAYGSIDARIDTQIEEIKKAILAARREPESLVIGG